MDKKSVYTVTAITLIVIAVVASVYWVYLKPQSIEFWAPFEGQDATLSFFKTVTEAFYNETGIMITPTFYEGDLYWPKLASSLAAGSPPDIFVVYPGGELDTYVSEGALADISELFSESWAQNQIPEGSIRDAVTRNGKQYALPYEMQTDWIFINRKLFEQSGVTVPTIEEGWTWDEFINASNAFKAANLTAVTMSGGASWSLTFPETYMFLRLNGADAFKNALARSESFENYYTAAFAKIQEWVGGGYFQTGWETQGYSDAQSLFLSGQAAMWIQGTWTIGITPDTADIKLDVVPFPYFPDRPEVKNIVFGQPTNFGIAAASQHKNETMAFLKFLSNPEWQTMYVAETLNPLAQNIEIPPGVYPETLVKVLDAVTNAPSVHMRFGTLSPTELGAYIDEQNLKVFTGDATPQEAAVAIEAKAVEIIGPVQP